MIELVDSPKWVSDTARGGAGGNPKLGLERVRWRARPRPAAWTLVSRCRSLSPLCGVGLSALLPVAGCTGCPNLRKEGEGEESQVSSASFNQWRTGRTIQTMGKTKTPTAAAAAATAILCCRKKKERGASNS